MFPCARTLLGPPVLVSIFPLAPFFFRSLLIAQLLRSSCFPGPVSERSCRSACDGFVTSSPFLPAGFSLSVLGSDRVPVFVPDLLGHSLGYELLVTQGGLLLCLVRRRSSWSSLWTSAAVSQSLSLLFVERPSSAQKFPLLSFSPPKWVSCATPTPPPIASTPRLRGMFFRILTTFP